MSTTKGPVSIRGMHWSPMIPALDLVGAIGSRYCSALSGQNHRLSTHQHYGETDPGRGIGRLGGDRRSGRSVSGAGAYWLNAFPT
jgi:hypothetical protein